MNARHSIRISPPFSVWSRAFFTRLLIASIIQFRSHKSLISSLPDKQISFPSCSARNRKCFLCSLQAQIHFLKIFQYNRTRIQLCDFQKTLYQCFYTVKLLLGKLAKFLYGRQFLCFALYNTIVNIESSKRCL